MRSSLAARLALLFACLSFAALAAVGAVLYNSLARHLADRDDAALVARVEQIRTLLQETDLISLIHQKPQLFANMLGNREALLVLRFAGQAPLIEVNPSRTPVPAVAPMRTSAPLALTDVQHAQERGGIPFSVLAISTAISGSRQDLEIIAGRLMTERSRVLRAYRNEILLVASCGALLLAGLAWWGARRGLRPLRALAHQTAAIGVRNLSTRIDAQNAPRELAPLIEGFNGMLDRLDRSFTQLSQVSADMAHDLRTPIGNLLGQTEVALGQKRDVAYYEKLLGSNFEELQRLSKMTDNMLFLARAENADNAIARKRLPLADELERMVDYFEGVAEEREVRIALHGDGIVWADQTLLRRALGNLMANAVRYAEPGSIIVLSAVAHASGIDLSVENRGPTIPPQHLARIFDRFYRADPARADSAAFSGLGLSIVRSIMTLHQGRWQATSQDGVTRFTLRFPHEPARP
ncbi:heavy metal sensor histidine kinase [Duganella dendranthematis]|uniref:Sensor protein n=1 Tax=Duganella dendranthematis TaxID=2728021 RepID=A0ABX6M8B8_9BURK|nr:heavy metal sensor histidine kinase [Duganella dendranthematis]QJD90360.1 heavy metal sensor histidine kinase [Duganella dendranthematis]